MASAIAARNPRLRDAVLADASGVVDDTTVADARATAAIMTMNNVLPLPAHDRKAHLLREAGGPADDPLVPPATSRIDFELCSLAVRAINGCEMCVRAHEETVIDGGPTADHVNDAVRIAATIYAAAVALEMGPAEVRAHQASELAAATPTA